MKRCLTTRAAGTRAIVRLMAAVRLAVSPALIAQGGLRSQFSLVNPSLRSDSDSFTGHEIRTNSIRNEQAEKYQWYGNTGFIRGVMPRFAGAGHVT